MDAWASFSREYSDARGNDEWELQAIVRRRVVARRETAPEDRGAGGDYDDAETAMLQRGGGRTAGWGGGKKAAKGRALDAGTSARGPAKEQQYLCQWRWYGEMTWEPRAVLEELGFKQQCDQHDAAIALSTESSARKAHLASVGIRGHPPPPATAVPVRVINHQRIERNLNRLFSELPLRLRHLFNTSGLLAKSFSYVANSEVVARFFHLWSQHPEAMPTLLFHGTRSVCIAPIIECGLLVPGEGGVTVRNGAACGHGIYTAKQPSISKYYCNDSKLMFVCIGLRHPSVTTFESSSVLVFNRSDAVFPAWLVHFDECSRATAQPASQGVPEVSLAELPWFGAHVDPALLQERKLPTVELKPTAPDEGEKAPPRFSHWEKSRMSKKMLKQAPRFVKDLYNTGDLRPKK